jgi:hypothetical protein
MDDSPKVRLLLELNPFEVRRVNVLQVFHQASIELWLSKEPVGDNGESGLGWSAHFAD